MQIPASTDIKQVPVMGVVADPPVRIMLVDDSLVVRSVLERIIGTYKEFDVVASMASAINAVEYLKENSVDIVILDVEMPDRSGLDALPDILQHGGEARVLVLSSICEEGGPAAVRALSLGACDTLAKPGRSSFAGSFSETLTKRLRQLTKCRSEGYVATEELSSPIAEPEQGTFECIAIGASTGGIPAIQSFLNGLDQAVSAPILLTQHLPGSFIPFLVRQLDSANTRPVVLAENGMWLEQGKIYVAPGEGHLTVEKAFSGARIVIVSDSQNTRYMPAVDPMFRSVAEVFGAQSLAVILSGMGSDGLLGAQKMRAVGANIYAQDPKSCVVWGMPGQIARAGIAAGVMEPAKIAKHFNNIWKAKV